MKSYYADYLGAKLHYRVGGKQDAPILVLLHGGFGSIDDFAELIPFLRRHFHLVSVDTRGHGRSTLGDVSLTYAQAADDIKHILQQMNITKFSILGFSDGGTIAYRLGTTEYGVEKIITVGAHWHSDNLQEVRSMFEALDIAFVNEYMAEQIKVYFAQNPQANLEKWISSLKAMWLDESASGYPNEAVAQIRAPVLAVRGEADFLLSLKDMAALQQHLPDIHLMNVPFAAHEVLKEQPNQLWAAIQAFFK
ncbi:alpha/beta fold hydrolase [Exercitatus varius]|uniref:Alpha/beta fold hydrolase n=1 Tax=Exercitatus varius TaxID=67857 RepID=A0AAW6QC34_9PAST|nr:alpha/beta fold hydrolase [Exercitatus varius]MDG2949789.1 alpha/beta fold hydrolase [Exercitatus varius]